MASTVKQLHKIFVSPLPWTIGTPELKLYFSRFGYIADAKVIFDRESGMSKRYGFVEVTDKNTLNSILNHWTHNLDGKPVVVKKADD